MGRRRRVDRRTRLGLAYRDPAHQEAQFGRLWITRINGRGTAERSVLQPARERAQEGRRLRSTARGSPISPCVMPMPSRSWRSWQGRSEARRGVSTSSPPSKRGGTGAFALPPSRGAAPAPDRLPRTQGRLLTADPQGAPRASARRARKATGQRANAAKAALGRWLDEAEARVEASGEGRGARRIPHAAAAPWRGALHPITLAIQSHQRDLLRAGLHPIRSGTTPSPSGTTSGALNFAPDNPAWT